MPNHTSQGLFEAFDNSRDFYIVHHPAADRKPLALADQDPQDKWTTHHLSGQNPQDEGTHHHLAADLDPQDEGAQHHSVADQNGRGEVTTHDPVAAQDSGRMWVLGDLPAGQQDDGWDEVEWY